MGEILDITRRPNALATSKNNRRESEFEEFNEEGIDDPEADFKEHGSFTEADGALEEQRDQSIGQHKTQKRCSNEHFPHDEYFILPLTISNVIRHAENKRSVYCF